MLGWKVIHSRSHASAAPAGIAMSQTQGRLCAHSVTDWKKSQMFRPVMSGGAEPG